MNHVESQDILYEIPFAIGFRQKHSCVTQLLLTVDDIAGALDRNVEVDVGILQ